MSFSFSWARILLRGVCFALFLAVYALTAPAALAESPWWHLSTSTRPSYLQPGQETDEVWQLSASASAGTYVLQFPGNVQFELNVGEEPKQLQVEFEGFYGAGNVEVTGGPGPEHNNPFEVYEIKFVKNLAYRHPNFRSPQEFLVQKQAENEATLTGGRRRVELKEVAQGRPAGLILVTAVNLGDANAGCVKVAPGAGKFTSASCEEAGAGEYEKVPITLKDDRLPAGLEPVWIEGIVREIANSNYGPLECSLGSLSCTFTGVGDEIQDLPPYQQMQMRIAVNRIEPKANGAVNEASVTGGGAPPASAKQTVTVSEHAPPFGVNEYEMRFEEDGGGTDTQAGSHPFQFTTTLNFNQTIVPTSKGANKRHPSGLGGEPIALAKTLHFKLPPGLIGNPAALPQCSLAQFFTEVEGINQCPQQSIVGVARVTVSVPGELANEVGAIPAPLYNLEPAVGEPARFGFSPEGEKVLIDTAVRSGGDYGVTATAENITQQASFMGSEVTFWGVPGDPRHDNQRGIPCFRSQTQAEREAFGCHPLGESKPPPFLSLPTSCSGLALQTTMEGDSWASFVKPSEVLAPLQNTAPMATIDGCNRLPFSPSIKVTPDGSEASKPMGMNVDVHVNQDSISSAGGLAESNVKNITVTLPQGVAINPSGGDGLQACSEALVGFQGFEEPKLEPGVSVPAFTPRLPGSTAALAAGETEPLSPGLNFCANASKIGEVTIKTPLLPAGQLVKGFVYLATQNQNPFGSLIALYIVAEDPVSGTLVKLPGAVHLTASGQVVTTFENNPQLAFEDAELHFFGGERAPLSSPAHCGPYTTTASFTPWSGNEAVSASSTFNITSGPNGTPCPGASLPFSPSLTGGTTNINAGAFSPLTTTIGREDGNQDLQSVQLHMPAGLEGILAGVKLCPEAQANEGTCGPESQIGETTVSAGVGTDPVSVKGGKVYITEKYAGAPFGLSIVNPVKAGPFDLERDSANPAQNPPCDCVVVRAKIEVDPHTAALTVTTDSSGPHAIPHLIDGIPVQIKRVNVLVNREHFTFNPTNCNPLTLTGTIASDEGASSPVSVPFRSTNCTVLKFAPKLTVTTEAHSSKANGASLTFKISYPGGAMGAQSWFKEARFVIPKQLPARLTTIQKACLAATFEANPAACPPGSLIGHAIVHTEVLPVPLTGPVYFVSHGGAKFPDAVIVLQGYGINFDLVGETFINGKTGVTSATFPNTPDVPFESIEVVVPRGPTSEFTANLPAKAKGSLCGQKLVMPTLFKAQNGLEIKQNTPIGVSGCPKPKKATRAQRLAAALRACARKKGNRRAACARAARRRYGAARR